MSDLVTLSSSVVPRSARVVGFRGTEAISRPYEMEIFLSLPQELGEEFDLADAIGAKARLIIDRQKIGVAAHVFAGIFASVEVMHAFEGRLLLRAILVPRLWQLGLSRHSRVFTKVRVPDILAAVLEENGVTDFELRLGPFEVEDHVCQYRESDLDFISRWMEREGIFYFFEHTEDGEKLVLCDKRLYDEDEGNGPVRYYPQLGHDHSSGPAFRSFRCRHSTLPASVRLKDYDYAKPNLPVTGSSRVASNGSGEVSLYGERFFTPSAGERLAKVRAEEMLARQVIFHAVGNRLHLRPGYAFELEEHPFPSFNARYLTIEAHHSGNQSAGLSHFRELTGIEHEDVYQVEVSAIPASTQFRAESKTAWPRIYGFENGVVDGPADSDYAQIDDLGRYLCKLKFDESKLKNGKATTWVRMMQPHGGDIEGFHFPLRKGTEVIFAFMGGDCDRPVITGVVPNAVNPSPVTSANHTRNVIQTGGRNRMEMEDKAGSEWMRHSTPYANTFINMGLAFPQHELNLGTAANAGLTAAGSFDIAVGVGEPAPSGAGNMTIHVQNNLTTTVDNQNLTTTVSTGDMTTTVQAGNETHNVNAGTFTEKVQSDVSLTYNATKTEHVDNGQVTETFKAQKTDIAENLWLTTGQQMNIHAVGQHYVQSDASLFHVVKGTTSVKTTGTTSIDTTETTHIHSGGNITIDTPADITIEGAHVSCSSKSEEWSVAGLTIEHKFDNHISMTAGMTLELKAGIFLEGSLAAKFSATAGIKADLDMAIDLLETPMKLAVAQAGFSFNAPCFMVTGAEIALMAPSISALAAITIIA